MHVHFQMFKKLDILRNLIVTNWKSFLSNLTSLEVKGTIIPTVPDKVVYTTTSDPPGISVVLCRERIVSPT